MSEAVEDYNLDAIRELLREAFTDATLRRLFLYTENRALHPLVDEFSARDTLSAMVDTTIIYCVKRALLPDLLAEVKKENPRQYARFEPDLRMAAAPPPPPAARPQPPDKLLAHLDDLRRAVRDYAPPDRGAEALAQAAALQKAVSGEHLDLARMEAVLRWFDRELPALSGAVLSAILSAEPRAEREGDQALLDFRRRFDAP